MHDIITVKNAKLQTVTVAIESLTVNGRQVTLAIYRQLIEEELIDYSGELRGLPWGTVNYHPHCEVKGPHVHVVWQKGDQLRRATQLIYDNDRRDFDDCSEADDYAKLLMRDIALGRRENDLKFEDFSHYCTFIKNGLKIIAVCDDEVVQHLDNLKYLEKRRADDRKEIKAIKQFFRDMPGDLDVSERALDAVIKEEIKRRKRHKASIEEIKKLPQLFIAV